MGEISVPRKIFFLLRDHDMETGISNKPLDERLSTERSLVKKWNVNTSPGPQMKVYRSEDGSFSILPMELCHKIFSFLQAPDLGNIFLLNSNFRKLSSNEDFFKTLYKSDGGSRSAIDEKTSWKKLYQKFICG